MVLSLNDRPPPGSAAVRHVERMLSRLEGRDNRKTKTYAVLSTPRVGSNLLCRSLDRSGVLGLPDEWFNDRFINEVHFQLGWKDFDLNRYVQTVVTGSKTDNGVFGVKIHLEQCAYWAKRGVDLLKLGFDKIYYVERKDKIAQAYSLAKGNVTNEWTSEDDLNGNCPTVEIGPAEVAAALSRICSQIEAYRSRLDTIVDRRIEFEALVMDQAEKATRTIIADLDLAVPEGLELRSNLKKQSGEDRARKVDAIRAYFNGANFNGN